MDATVFFDGLSSSRIQFPGETPIKQTCFLLASLLAASLLAPASYGQLHVLVDQVGYDATAPRQAILQGTAFDHPAKFTLVDTTTGKVVFTGTPQLAGSVYDWRVPHGNVYWIADFSAWTKPGHYALHTRDALGPAHSCAFQIEKNLLERTTLSNVIY